MKYEILVELTDVNTKKLFQCMDNMITNNINDAFSIVINEALEKYFSEGHDIPEHHKWP